jgi:hypothetical protein
MRWELPKDVRSPHPTVVFDPKALAEFLSEDPHPRSAICRWPRRIERERKRGNALVLDDPGFFEAGCVVVEGEDAADVEIPDLLREQEHRALRVPSGRLLVASPAHPSKPEAKKPAAEVGAVRPGLYRVRPFSHDPGLEPGKLAEDRLDADDREALDIHRETERKLKWRVDPAFLYFGGLVILGLCEWLGFSDSEKFEVARYLGLAVVWALVFVAIAWWRSRHHPHTKRAMARLKEEKKLVESREATPDGPPLRSVYVLERVGDL